MSSAWIFGCRVVCLTVCLLWLVIVVLQSDSSYGDRILIVALINVLFQEYPKLSQSYYALLEILAQDHMNFLSSLEPQVSSVVACEG